MASANEQATHGISIGRLVGTTAIADMALSIVATVVVYNLIAGKTLVEYSGAERIGAALGLVLLSFGLSFAICALLSAVFLWQVGHTRLLRLRFIAKPNQRTRANNRRNTPWKKLLMWTVAIDTAFQVPMIITTLLTSSQETANLIYGVMTVDVIGTVVSFPFDLLIVYLSYRVKDHFSQKNNKEQSSDI
jgi:hypothetical protein